MAIIVKMAVKQDFILLQSPPEVVLFRYLFTQMLGLKHLYSVPVPG